MRPDFDPDQHCGAHPTAPDGPCRARKGAGSNHLGTGRCRHHGGTTPSGEKYARVEQARAAVAAYGLPREVDPATALLEEVARTAGAIDWLRIQVERVSGEDIDALVRGTKYIRKTVDQDGTKTVSEAGPGVHEWLQLYREERSHLVRVCAAALAAGVEERRIRMAESSGALLAGVIRAVLDDLGLSVEQQGRVAEVVPRHLRAVNG